MSKSDVWGGKIDSFNFFAAERVKYQSTHVGKALGGIKQLQGKDGKLLPVFFDPL